MANISLTMACGPYDRTEALRNGDIRPEGIDLTYLPVQSPPEIFGRMIQNHAFDIAEMSCAVYMTRRSKGDFPFVALPIFPSRLFRHGFIFINAESGIVGPKDLEGKRVGVPEYQQTAAIWIRGILQHEYDVDLNTINWALGGVNTPRQASTMDLKPEGPASIEFIPDGETLNGLLERGEIDALIGARRPASLGKNPKVKRLFPNYREVEREYYQRTGIFPIMHTLVLREELYKERPWIAESMFKAMVQAKEMATEHMRFSGAMRYMVPWLFDDLDEMDDVFGPDPWPYGLEPNLHTLQTLAQYLTDQGFLHGATAVEEMFAPIVVSNE